jgi:hypothetical protein
MAREAKKWYIEQKESGIAMPRKMTITVKIEGEEGQAETYVTEERDLPTLREFETKGFRPSINQIDKAFLEARKEATEKAVTGYLEGISQKKNRRRNNKAQ